jgi:mannitol-1-/sugar-/sorbitol-6-phosphatase
MLDCAAMLFDLDGTLVDSSAVVDRTWTAWSALHGLNSLEVLAAAQGRRALDTVRTFLPKGDLVSEVARLEALEMSEVHHVKALPGAMEALYMLMDHQWAVVTSGTRELAFARLDASGLPRPRVLVGARDVGRGKPDPEGYLSAALRLKVDPTDCIAFEDAPAGVDAAVAAGCTVIGLTTTHRIELMGHAAGIVPSLGAVRIARKDDRLHLLLRSDP